MSQYLVKTTGCDASTRVLVELTDDQAAGVALAASAITNASEYGCMPKLSITLATEADLSDLGYVVDSAA